MKVFSIVFLFVFGLSVSAQSPAVANLFSEGTQYVNVGRFDAALASYKDALLLSENEYAPKEFQARLHYNIGVCYFNLDRFDIASDQFKSAVLLKTDYALAYYALGITKQKAVATLDRASAAR